MNFAGLPPAASTPRRRFAVSVVRPLGYVHSAAFDEAACALHHGLLALGHESVISSRLDNRRRHHIVLGANLLPRFPAALPADAIVWNLEQVQAGSAWFNDEYVAILRRHRVWDYSVTNAAALASLGVDATVVPVGHVPALERIEPVERDIDVLFYGSMNERRHSVLQSLHSRGVRVHSVFGVYGEARDALIARSRIVLNLHFYESKVFEIVRVSYLLANRVCVVSETGTDPASEAQFADGVAFAPYEQLADRCIALLADPTARDAIADRGQAILRRMPMAAGLATAIAQLPQEASA